MLEKLYDWIGIASIILEHRNGEKHAIVADLHCGTGKSLAYLKKLLALYGLDIYTIGMIPYGSTYENLTSNNLDKIIYPDQQNIGADYVIALDIGKPMMNIDAQELAKRGGMLIYSDNNSLHIPKILSSEKNQLVQGAQKYHKIAREIDGNPLDEFIEIPKYESMGIPDRIIHHAKEIKRQDLIIVDAGCGSGQAALELKTRLEKNKITTIMIGIDFQSHYENCLDDFVQSKIEDMKTPLSTADVVISVGSGPLLPLKRVKFIKNCGNMLRPDGIYIENNGVFAGQYVCVKKKEIKKYISITKSAKVHETPYIGEVNSIHEFAFMNLNPVTNHQYKKRLERYKIDPYMFAMTFLRHNEPRDWKADNYGGLKLETLFKQYIKDGTILLHDDLFEINL